DLVPDPVPDAPGAQGALDDAARGDHPDDRVVDGDHQAHPAPRAHLRVERAHVPTEVRGDVPTRSATGRDRGVPRSQPLRAAGPQREELIAVPPLQGAKGEPLTAR